MYMLYDIDRAQYLMLYVRAKRSKMAMVAVADVTQLTRYVFHGSWPSMSVSYRRVSIGRYSKILYV